MLVRILLVLFLAVATNAIAQNYSMRNFTAVDGLPQSQVNAMVEDANGYLWIGTFGGGLARFDGKEFKVYTTLDGLYSNIVSYLLLDSHQNLWIVHPHGITKFDGQTFKQIKTPVISQKYIWKLFNLNDTIFFQVGSQGSIGKIYHDSITVWDQPVMPGKKVYYSIRTTLRSICYLLNDSSFFLLHRNGSRNKISYKGIFSTVREMVNYQRNILLNTDRGYYFFDYTRAKFWPANVSVKDHIVAFDSLSMTFWVEKAGGLWKQPVNSSEPSDKVITDISVLQILFDREGNAWMGTSGNGLYRYAMPDFEKCASGKLGSVMTIAQDKSGSTWLGSRRLVKINHGKITNYQLNSSNRNEVMEIKVDSKNEVWIASLGGLGRYNSKQDNFKWYTREHGLSSQYISCIDFDTEGNLWCGTVAGLNSFDGNKFKSYQLADGQEGKVIRSLRYFAKLKTLFASSEQGLFALHNGEVKKADLPEFANTPIISMNVYKDSVMLLGSMGSGIMIYDPVHKSKKIISSKDGLPSNLIYFVAPDKENLIWVGTEQGITRLRLNKEFEVEEIHNHGYDNGLIGVETNQNAYYLGKEKYFGLVDGVYQFNDKKKESTYSYPLHLTGVEVFYGEISSRNYSDSAYSFFKIPYKPVLPSSKNHITFYFNRVDKENPKSVQYKYFLENFDKAWSLPTDHHMVTYGNLPPGKYILQVKAINHRGGWDDQPLSYAFTVKAPFYQTATFIVLAVSLVAGLIILVSFNKVRARMRKTIEIERIRQQEQEHLRKEIARDFHDEMGNQLTRIINYISLMKLSQNGHAVEFYNKVEGAAKYLYTGTRDFIWSIDPVNDELTKLFFHIRDFGEKLFEEKGISFRAYNELKEKVQLPYGFSREANLIMKEAMTNAFNHSQAKNVSFTLKRSPDGFEMELKDDGIGFSPEALEKTNGLSNMRTRSSRIKSDIKINSKTSNGTEVHLVFPEFKTQLV
jgi:ligand-binding sensor domain-containing protein/signal transduction histidine kinase